MALQVWLPLTKDTRQQGLSSISVTGSPAAWNNGKLGKCAYWNGAVANVLYNNTTDFNYTDNFSVAFWANPVYTGSTVQYAWTIGRADAGGYGYGFQIINATTAYFRFGNGSYSVSAPSNEWHHFVMTVGNSKVTIYKDGSQVSSNNLPGTIPTYSDGNGMGLGCFHYSSNIYPYYGSLNDFRIYDHCLSPMEVKEISKGLILHYPLNRGGWGQENLFLNTSTPATWSKALNDSGYAVNDCFKTQSPVPSLFSVDELITISFDWSTAATGGNFHVECGAVTPWVWGTVINSKGTRNSASNYVDITSSNKSGHVEITFKITSNQTGAADTLQWFRIRQDGTDTANKTFTISKAKLERGSIATPWCPNSSDALANTIGLNSTTEYDTSGYCNNGMRINFSQQNLLLGSDFSSQYTSNLVTNSSTDWSKYLRGYNTSTGFTFSNGECTTTLNAAANLGVCFVRKATDINLDHNSYYTLSCEAKSTQTTKPLCIGLTYYNNSNTWIWRGGTNPTNFTTANTWQKFYLTFKPDVDTQYISYCFTVVGVANGTDTFTIRHCKLEKGSNMTPWVNRESDNWSSDTPKYQVSTKFDSTSSKIKLPVMSFTEMANSYTFAWWQYNVSTGNMPWGFSDGNRLNCYHTSPLCWNTGDGGNNQFKDGNTTIAPATVQNGWHHMVVTGDGTATKLYIDGVYKGTATTYKPLTGTQIWISGWDGGTSYTFNGSNESDFRIYATALSADDVLSLYQNSAYIDSNGNVYGAVHSEV